MGILDKRGEINLGWVGYTHAERAHARGQALIAASSLGVSKFYDYDSILPRAERWADWILGQE